MSTPDRTKWYIKQFVTFALCLMVMEHLWTIGFIGKAITIVVFALWCRWAYQTGYAPQELKSMLLGNGIFLAFWVLSQYQRTLAYAIALPLVGFCGYMCWREQRGHRA